MPGLGHLLEGAPPPRPDVAWSCQAQPASRFPWMVRLQPLCLAHRVTVPSAQACFLLTVPGNNPPAQAACLTLNLWIELSPGPWLCDPTPEVSLRTGPSLSCPASPLGKRPGNKDREDLISPKRSCESSRGRAVGGMAASVTAEPSIRCTNPGWDASLCVSRCTYFLDGRLKSINPTSPIPSSLSYK